MKQCDKAYIAGLFDGEGDVCIQAYRSGKGKQRYLRIFLRIMNTNKPVLEWVRSTVGVGSVGESKRKNQDRRLPVYRWAVTNANAKKFLIKILPFLHIKAEKVREILASRHSGREISARVPSGNGVGL